MRYTKPALSFEQQADQLIRRGLVADRDLLIERLRVVSYYRLSGYWYPFRKPDPSATDRRLDDLEAGTTFEVVWNRYVFDRRLRLLVMDAIERIEVAVRTSIAYHHAHDHGPFAYAIDPSSIPGIDGGRRSDLLDSIRRERRRSKEPFIRHFEAKYASDHSDLPVWMAIEIMSFGHMLTMYRGCSPAIKKKIARSFDVHDVVFDSWLGAIHVVRNICAHHGRLWNRVLGVKPMIPRPKNDDRWHAPISVGNERAFGLATICKHCMDCVAQQSDWPHRVRRLIEDAPDIPLGSMGFPTNWLECPIWASVNDANDRQGVRPTAL